MQKIKTLSPYQKIEKIRRFVYIFVIVAGLFNIFFPVIAHADIFNNEVQDLYVKITENVKETNDILDDAFQLCQTSPYTIMNNAVYNSQSRVTGAIHSACQTVALVVATLLLMVDFFRKTTNFEWASKWETGMPFLGVQSIAVPVSPHPTDSETHTCQVPLFYTAEGRSLFRVRNRECRTLYNEFRHSSRSEYRRIHSIPATVQLVPEHGTDAQSHTRALCRLSEVVSFFFSKWHSPSEKLLLVAT